MLHHTFTQKFPLLASAISEGKIYLQEATYHGRAADGEIVPMGCQSIGSFKGDERAIERYLTSNPTPDTW